MNRAEKGRRVTWKNPCGSELARDGLKNSAFIQTARIIVDVHR